VTSRTDGMDGTDGMGGMALSFGFFAVLRCSRRVAQQLVQLQEVETRSEPCPWGRHCRHFPLFRGFYFGRALELT
jgi:hypothetical protein